MLNISIWMSFSHTESWGCTMFLEGVIINISMLITGFYFISKLSKFPLDTNISPLRQILIGLCNGLLCFILMKFSIPTFSHTLIDFRHIPLIIAACYIGAIPTMITAIMIAITRLTFDISPATITISTCYIFIGIILSIYSQHSQRSMRYRAIQFSTITIVMICVSYLLITKDLIRTLIFTGLITSYSTVGLLLAFMLLKDLKKQKTDMMVFQDQAQQDFLTRLLNKRMFEQTLRDMLNAEENIVLMLMDIDYFKQVNDKHGHDAGDTVLKEVAEILNTYTEYQQKNYRIGGEEFSAVFTDSPVLSVIRIAEKIRQQIASHPFVLPDGKVIHITISIGLSCSKNVAKNSISLFRRADRALYQAKSDGRNKVIYATDDA